MGSPVSLSSAVDLGYFAVPGERDLGVGERACLHSLGGAEGVAPVDTVTVLANLVRNVASSTAVSPPPTTAMSWSRKKNPSQVAH